MFADSCLDGHLADPANARDQCILLARPRGRRHRSGPRPGNVRAAAREDQDSRRPGGNVGSAHLSPTASATVRSRSLPGAAPTGQGGSGSPVTACGKDAMEHGFAAAEIDTSRPHPARMYDAYLGGKDNYAADREAVRQVLRAAPEVRDTARANRAFLQRAVRFLAGEAGIRQFLDIGTGIPVAGNVHEGAGQVAPGTRVVYMDNDPIVHTHANALLAGNGTTRIVLADLREPEVILGHPSVGELIDFSEPVGLLLVAIVHFVTDDEQPAQIVATLRDALPPGSYLALSHATADFRTEAARLAAAVYDQATSTLTLRGHAQIAALFDGWDLVDPGLVQISLSWPDGKPPRPKDLSKVWGYGGVGRRGS